MFCAETLLMAASRGVRARRVRREDMLGGSGMCLGAAGYAILNKRKQVRKGSKKDEGEMMVAKSRRNCNVEN